MARPDKSYLEKQTSRRPEKKKTAIGEGSPDSRMAKISFKNYLRQIEEDLLDEDDDMDDADDRKLPSNNDEVQEVHNAFLENNEDLIDTARGKETAEEGAEFLMTELKNWLERERGFNAGEVDDWMESPSGQEMYEVFLNGLT